MSRRGEKKGFRPHPGDPWHPEWQPDDEEAASPIAGEDPWEGVEQSPAPPPKKAGRLGRSRRRHAAPEEVGESADADEFVPSEDAWADAEPPAWVPDEAGPVAAPVPVAGELVAAEDDGDQAPAVDNLVKPDEADEAETAEMPLSWDSPPEDTAPPSPAIPQPFQEYASVPRPPAVVASTEDAGAGLVAGPGNAIEAAASAPSMEPPDALETTEVTEEDDWIAFVGGSAVEVAPPPVAIAPASGGRRRWFGSRKGEHQETPAEALDQDSAELPDKGEVAPPPWDPDLSAEVTEDPTSADATGEAPRGLFDDGGEPAIPAATSAGVTTAQSDDADISDEDWERLFGGMNQEPTAASSGAVPASPVLPVAAGVGSVPAFPPPGTGVGPRQSPPASGDTWAALRNVLEAETVEMEAPMAAGSAVLGFEPMTGEIFAGAATVEHRGLAEAVAAADTAETELQALSAPMAGLDMGVVGFEDVVDLGSDEEFVAPASSDFVRRTITGLIMVAMLLGALWVGGAFMAAFIGLVMFLGLTEYHRTLRSCGHRPLALFGYLGAIGLLLGTWHYGLVAVPIGVVGTAVVVFFYYALAQRRRDPLTNGGLTVLGVAWVTGTAAFAFPIVASPDARVLILALAAATVAMDVGAYSAGRSWGSSPLAPNVSPNKTVEGLAGGVVLTIGVAVAIGYFFEPLDIRSGAALGLVVAVAAPLGDLAESMLKRSLGVKDMGSMLPGHGGILDRVDAFLFVLPAAWVLYQSLGLLG